MMTLAGPPRRSLQINGAPIRGSLASSTWQGQTSVRAKVRGVGFTVEGDCTILSKCVRRRERLCAWS